MDHAEREELVAELEAVDNAIAAITTELRAAYETRGVLVAKLGEEEPAQEPALAMLDEQPPRDYHHRLVHPAHFGLEFVPNLLERPAGTEVHLLRRLPEGIRQGEYPDLLRSLCGHEYPWRRWEEVEPRGNNEGLVELCIVCAQRLDEHRQVEQRRC